MSWFPESMRSAVNNLSLGMRLTCHILRVWPWTSYLILLSLVVFICNMGSDVCFAKLTVRITWFTKISQHLGVFKYYNQEIGKDAQDWILRMLDESSGTSSEIRESMSIWEHPVMLHDLTSMQGSWNTVGKSCWGSSQKAKTNTEKLLYKKCALSSRNHGRHERKD